MKRIYLLPAFTTGSITTLPVFKLNQINTSICIILKYISII